MKELLRWRARLIAVATATLVAVAYELDLAIAESTRIPNWLLAFLTFVVSIGPATMTVGKALSLRTVRRLMMSTKHVEGFWWLATDPCGDNEPISGSPLLQDGLLFIRHNTSAGESKVVTTRLATDSRVYPTESEMAYVRDDGVGFGYINHFRLTFPGPEIKFGLSAGRFMATDDVAAHPNWLEAQITVAGEPVVYRQSAQRIPEQAVKDLKRQHGKDWVRQALVAGRQSVFGDGL